MAVCTAEFLPFLHCLIMINLKGFNNQKHSLCHQFNYTLDYAYLTGCTNTIIRNNYILFFHASMKKAKVCNVCRIDLVCKRQDIDMLQDEGEDGLCACVQCPLLITQYIELSVCVSTDDVAVVGVVCASVYISLCLHFGMTTCEFFIR